MKRLTTIVTELLIGTMMMAQSRSLNNGIEAGFMFGLIGYNGELSGFEYRTDELNAAAGGLVRFNWNDYLSFRFHIYAGNISGRHANLENEPTELIKNLSFRNTITEFGFIGEFNILRYNNFDERFSPYLFAGVVAFHHNPETLFDGTWHDLQPLSTEGQGTTAFPDRSPYSLWQFAVPYGIGIKAALNDLLNIGFEIGMRYTFTDYLDDVSQTYVDPDILLDEKGRDGVISASLSNRSGEVTPDGTTIPFGNTDPRGDPTNDDAYFIAGLNVTFNVGVLFTGKSGCSYSNF